VFLSLQDTGLGKVQNFNLPRHILLTALLLLRRHLEMLQF
jgi:hypothetical protein